MLRSSVVFIVLLSSSASFGAAPASREYALSRFCERDRTDGEFKDFWRELTPNAREELRTDREFSAGVFNCAVTSSEAWRIRTAGNLGAVTGANMDAFLRDPNNYKDAAPACRDEVASVANILFQDRIPTLESEARRARAAQSSDVRERCARTIERARGGILYTTAVVARESALRDILSRGDDRPASGSAAP